MFVNNKTPGRLGWIALLSGLIATSSSARAEKHQSTQVSRVSLFAEGLNNPRGLKFGPAGYLYVAEGGVGGSQSTVGQCEQVPAPIGPYTGSDTGARISRISPTGERTTLVDNLPSSQTTAETGGFVSGVGDIAFIGHTLYAVLAGAGCSHGVPNIPNGVLRVESDGSAMLVADLSAFQQANPVANPEEEDFEPDGTWYSMVSWGETLYALEPNHGELDMITRDGQVSRVIDISATEAHAVPTAMTLHHGQFYVGALMPFPASPVAKVYRISRDGEINVVAEGLTTVLGIGFRGNQLYVLETSAPVTSPGPPVLPGTGQVVRVSPSGSLEPVVTGLMFPSAMTFSPNGDLYISNFGFGFPPGYGQIVKVEFGHSHDDEGAE